MKKYSLSALVAAGLLAGGLSVTSANAADLGGNCCADLEERIAELEATTARKGNRKVSLTISGWVAEQVMWWDNGEESNTYVGGIGSTLNSHVKFTGQATISPGWTAGYVLHLEATGNDSLTQNEDVDNGGNLLCGSGFGAGAPGTNGVCVLQSYWFVKSDHLGKFSLGKQSQASDNTAILVDGSGSLVPANWVLFDVLSFGIGSGAASNAIPFLRFSNCGGMGGAAGDCNGFPEEVVRYDSPTFGGFSFSASWGEDDIWDVAARYAGEFSGFKLAAAVAYNESTDNPLGGTIVSNTADFGTVGTNFEAEYFQVGAYAQHIATGLFLYGAYGHFEREADGATFNQDQEADTYYVKAGIRQRWHPLGHTVLYGEYLNTQADYDAAAVAATSDNELDLWGIGVVQEIDAAAMSMWLSYRHYEGEEGQGALKNSFEDFDLIKFGALINF